MGVAELSEAVKDCPELLIRLEEPLAAHVPLRVGGPAEAWAEARSLVALERFTAAARATNTRWRLHWPFSDWLVRDGGLQGAVLRLGTDFESIEITDDTAVVGSAALWSSLPPELAGGLWDAIREWPGTVGALVQHGDPSQLSRLVTGLQVLRGGRVVDLSWNDTELPPKMGDSTVLLSITMRRATASRTWLTPPPSPGTLFQNVNDAVIGKELHKAGVLGTRLRSWRLSTVEPGTIVHLGRGSFQDLAMLLKGVKVRVEKTRGITLEPRIPILGTNQRPAIQNRFAAQPQRDTP